MILDLHYFGKIGGETHRIRGNRAIEAKREKHGAFGARNGWGASLRSKNTERAARYLFGTIKLPTSLFAQTVRGRPVQ